MLTAACRAYPDSTFDYVNENNYGVFTRPVLEAALRWLSEHPVVPSQEQANAIAREYRGYPPHCCSTQYVIAEWQRRMFLASEQKMIGYETLDQFCSRFQTIGEAAFEAYRRGQKSK